MYTSGVRHATPLGVAYLPGAHKEVEAQIVHPACQQRPGVLEERRHLRQRPKAARAAMRP
jgi:hypothetical protein